MAVMSALWHGAPEQGGEDTALENFFEQAAQRWNLILVFQTINYLV